MKKFFFLLLLFSIVIPCWTEPVDTYKENDFKGEPTENGIMYMPMDSEIINTLNSSESKEIKETEDIEEKSKLSKSYLKIWGDNAVFTAYIDAEMSIEKDNNGLKFNSHFYAGGDVFKKTFRAFTFESNVENNKYKDSVVKIKGQSILDSVPDSEPWSKNEAISEFSKEWFIEYSHSRTFYVGIIPLSVSASITGSAGIIIGGIEYIPYNSCESPCIVATITPSVSLEASVTASVGLYPEAVGGIVPLEGGLEAKVTILKVEIPFTAAVEDNNDLNLYLQIDLVLTVLKGDITLYCEIPIKGRYERVLWQWNGIINKEYQLYNNMPQD